MKANTLALILALAAVAALGLATVLGGYAVVRAAGNGLTGWGPWRSGSSYGDRCPISESDAAPLGRSRPESGYDVESLEGATRAFEDYVGQLGYEGLHLTEVMEFERNYYAIVAEEDTGVGAMELLVDKRTGAVTPEPGPNMMWNSKYGMHGGSMMGRSLGSGQMVLSPEEASAEAQSWLDVNFPGRKAGEPDAFYGYYTLHFLEDGRVDGMLSVNGSTGQVWYHSWHGDFVNMTEHAD